MKRSPGISATVTGIFIGFEFGKRVVVLLSTGYKIPKSCFDVLIFQTT